VLDEVPLTLDDVLHPEEGDVIPESSLHGDERAYLRNVIAQRFTRKQRARVFIDCLINWGVPGLRSHSPDVSAFNHVAEPEREWGTFSASQQGARCMFVIELVSPKTRRNDVRRKPPEYHRAGVPLYVMVDQKRENGPRQFLAYRNTPDGFVPMPLDRQGCIELKPLGLLLGLNNNRVVCFDAVTGEEIPDYTGEVQARQAAELNATKQTQARRAAEARIRELEEELRRLRSGKKRRR
jgi:Uma2 family endonuclease